MTNFIKSLCSDYTIVHAFNNPRLEEERQQAINNNLSTNLKKGVYVGATGMIQASVVVYALLAITQPLLSNTNKTRKLDFIDLVIIAPIVEEVVFRGLLQNGLFYAQKFAKGAAPESMKNTRAFEWLTSPSARIFGTNFLFALAHLSNKNHDLNTGLALIQVSKLLLTPRCSILHETTGNIAAPIASHITNNFITYFI